MVCCVTTLTTATKETILFMNQPFTHSMARVTCSFVSLVCDQLNLHFNFKVLFKEYLSGSEPLFSNSIITGRCPVTLVLVCRSFRLGCLFDQSEAGLSICQTCYGVLPWVLIRLFSMLSAWGHVTVIWNRLVNLYVQPYRTHWLGRAECL